MSPRRELTLVAALCVAGVGLALLAVGRSWVQLRVAGAPGLPGQQGARMGAELLPVLPAASLAALAALGAVLASHGRWRRLVGLVLALLGAGVVAAVLRWRLGGADADWFAYLPPGEVAVRTTPWWALAVVGGLLQLLAGAWTVLRGPRWTGLDSRHAAPRGGSTASARRTDGEDLWKALDRGEDPTV